MSDKTTYEMISFFKETKKNPIFFFCGSGISFASKLPSVDDVLSATCEVFFPKKIVTNKQSISLDKEIRRVVDKVQPEIFYESLLSVTNNSFKCLNIWKCLIENDSKPNLSHLFITQYSYNNHSPIFTTNFDLMFEKAAEHLGIDYVVLLPEDNPERIKGGVLYICKIHGSIGNNLGKFTPESLLTTMTSITKKNVKWIKYIQNLMELKHICFVGYSGRDLDFFPFLEKKAHSTKKKVLWIDNFDKHSEKRSLACKALRLRRYPFDHSNKSGFIVDYVKEDQSYEHLTLDKLPLQSNINPKIDKYKAELIENNLLNSEYSKRFFYSCILKLLGEYSKAYEIALDIYLNHKNYLTEYQRNMLLLNLCQLSHEKSKYITCGKFAKKLITSKSAIEDNKLMGRLLQCESLRMRIANDIYFPTKREIKDYIFFAYVLTKFIYTSTLNHLFRFVKPLQYNRLDIRTKHEIIEHDIRLLAIVQGLLGNSRKGWSPIYRKYLYRFWLCIRNKSYTLGYSAGIANAQKFLYRINPDDLFSTEAEEIFNLITSSTGEELILRNRADKALADSDFENAKALYDSFARKACMSGNILNEIKGYIGKGYVNYIQKKKPYLEPKELKRLECIYKEVEGKQWRRQIGEIVTILKEQSNESKL